MNTIIIQTVPLGDFEEISIEMPEWRAKFLSLAQQGKRIKYHVPTMPTIPKDIQGELGKMGYCNFILQKDHDRHFLVPKLN